jgi:hypothetical protein
MFQDIVDSKSGEMKIIVPLLPKCKPDIDKDVQRNLLCLSLEGGNQWMT